MIDKKKLSERDICSKFINPTIQNTISQIKALYPGAKDEDVEKLVATASDYAMALTRVINNKKSKS
jgi:multidrug efflux pump subunit AcrB